MHTYIHKVDHVEYTHVDVNVGGGGGGGPRGGTPTWRNRHKEEGMEWLG